MATWHEEVAEAVKARDKAIRGVLRWQAKKHDAEKRIDELSILRKTDDAPVPAAALNEDVPLLTTEMHPVFGITADQQA